jgi:two-component system, NarL family, invasion response regulator UvrY
MINVVIADDHQLVREAWNLLLSRDKRLSIVAICENGDEVVKVCKKINPHVVLMDINMEPVSGIEATKAIREFSEDIRIIGISVHTDLPYVNALMQAGANGYVTKNSSGEEMIRAIFLVMEGQQYYCKEITDIIGNDWS